MRSARTRRMLLTTALASLAIVAIALIALRIASPPVEHPDYLAQMQALADARFTDGRNAWDVYEPVFDEIQALRELADEDDDALPSSLHDLMYGDWNDPRHAEARQTLELMRPLVIRAEAAIPYEHYAPQRMEGATPTTSDELIDEVVESGMSLGQLRTANAEMLREAAIQGRWADADRRVELATAMSRHALPGTTAMEHLVGLTPESVMLNELRRLLNEFEIPPERCTAFILILERAPNHVASLTQMLEGECLFARLSTKHLFDGEDDLSSSPARTLLAKWSGIEERRHLRDIDRVFDRAQEDWDRGYANPGDAEADLVSNMFADRLSLPATLQSLNSALYSVRRQALALQTSRAATLCMLRLELFHAQRNRWPDTLAEALGESGSLDPVSGLPFEYQLLADDPHNRPYELRIPTGAWHYHNDFHVLNPPRRPIPDRDEYNDPDFED